MDLDETDLGHQAVLSDHEFFGQYGQVRTAACSRVEWQMLNVRVLLFQAMIDDQSDLDMNVNYGWTMHRCSSACMVDHKYSFIKFLSQMFLICSIEPQYLSWSTMSWTYRLLVWSFTCEHNQRFIVCECSFFVDWGYWTLSITHSNPDSKICDVSISKVYFTNKSIQRLEGGAGSAH